jgi:hypothetical protein
MKRIPVAVSSLLICSFAASRQISRANQIDDFEREHACRRQVVLFGGGALNFLSDTWVWNGRRWEQKSPNTSPPGREGHAMAPDVARRAIVLFGGFGFSNDPSGLFADTWVWDGANWEEKFPATSPSLRAGHSLAYDAAHQDVVLFGGGAGLANLSDTWVWDGSNWEQKFPQNSPLARVEGAMAPAPAREETDPPRPGVVLFGGLYSAGNLLSDTWVWDGTNWEQKFPQNSPPARYGHAMALDVAHRVVVLFGGIDAGGNFLSDTWVWDGTNWEQKFPEISPPARWLHAMGPNADRRGVVLFGGEPVSDTDTWIWNGRNWEHKSPEISPSARIQPAMADNIGHDGCDPD